MERLLTETLLLLMLSAQCLHKRKKNQSLTHSNSERTYETLFEGEKEKEKGFIIKLDLERVNDRKDWKFFLVLRKGDLGKGG